MLYPLSAEMREKIVLPSFNHNFKLFVLILMSIKFILSQSKLEIKHCTGAQEDTKPGANVRICQLERESGGVKT